MKRILNKYWPLILVFALSFFVTWPLFKYGYFSHQDNLQVIRIFEMRKCFSDLQIPCRWVPDMGWGNGFPLFNFYGVSLYYLGALFSYIVGYIVSSKIIFFLSLVLGSFGIYLLAKSLWGKYAGMASAILYMFAPYKALDIYVRGALAESFALAIIPFVFYFGYKLIVSPKNNKKQNNKYGILFSLSLFVFMITHNIMVLIFIPILGLWMLYWLYVEKWKNFKNVVLYVLFGIGMSCFFILPAFLEKGLVQTESLLRFELDFRANYLRIYQLFFDRVWGYGTSVPGPEGGMNFQIGWPHWLLGLTSLVFIFNKKVTKKMKVLILGIVGAFLFSIFMTHNKSTFIWVNISLLNYFQFPWRFLSLSIFAASLLGGFIVSNFRSRWQLYLSVVVVLLSVLLNWQYFKPKEFYSIKDSELLSDASWDEQRKGALLDYLPKTALEPREEAPVEPLIVSGNAKTESFVNNSNKWKLDIEVTESSVIEVPVFYFPNWRVYVDGNKYPFTYDNILGRISFTLEPGRYSIDGKFENTPVRTLGNTLSLISIIGLAVYTIYGKNKKISK